MNKNRSVCLGFFWTTLLLGLLAGWSCDPSPSGGAGTISGIFPAGKAANLPAFTLTVLGEDFGEDAVVLFNGRQMVTTWVDETRLECLVDAASISQSSSNATGQGAHGQFVQAGETLIPVEVYSARKDETSNPVSFHLTEDHVFSTPVEIPLPAGIGIHHLPILAFIDQNQVFVAWDYSAGPDTQYYYTLSEDGGKTWASPKEIHMPDIGYNEALFHCSEPGHFTVLYKGTLGAMFSESTDMGASWTSAKLLWPDVETNSTLVKLFQDWYGNLFAVIESRGPRVFKRAKGSTEWQAFSVPTFSDAVYTSRFYVTSGSENLHMVWLSNQPPKTGEYYSSPKQIFLKTYSEANKAWSADLTTGFTKPGYHWFSFWDDEGRIAVMTDIIGVHMTRSEDMGQTWTEPLGLTQGGTYGFWADMDQKRNITSISNQGGAGHYMTRSVDGGKTFSQARYLTELHDGHKSLWINWIGMSPQGDVGMFWYEDNNGLTARLFFSSTNRH